MSAPRLLPTDRPRLHLLAGLAAALLLVVANVVAVTVASEQTAHAAPADLRVTPSNHVGGQRLTWTGNVGQPGKRPLVLQFHMGRPGDQWTTVQGFKSSTRSDGSFTFGYPAPSMFNTRYRVKAGSYVSPPKLFNAKTQELTIRITGHPESRTNDPGRVGAGRRFGITVDTTPDNIYRSPGSKGLPVFRGRVLTLQKRIDGDTWRTVDTTRVGAKGFGQFDGLKERAGVVVYRVRQENYFVGGNRIGWAQSFPLYVFVGRVARSGFPSSQTAQTEPVMASPPVTATKARTAAAGTPFASTASQRYGWQPSRWDFTWEHGQSLTSRPARGTNRRGSWLDYSDGSGRAQKYNGGLTISSKRYEGAGSGDFGTTRATLRGNSATYGRWETAVRIRNAFERGGRAYSIVAELVPARRSHYDCGRHNIEIASLSPYSRQVRFGVRSPKYRWRGAATASTTPLQRPYTVAVEVSRRHITWFLNGAPVGSATDVAAVPGVPMTMRLSLEGDGRAEMDQTSLISDWQRGFPLSTAPSTVSGNKLTRRAAAARCG